MFFGIEDDYIVRIKELEELLAQEEIEYNKLHEAALDSYIDMIEHGACKANEVLRELGFALGYRCIVCQDMLAEEQGSCCIGCLDTVVTK